jgi:hypothetical protein
MSLGSHHFRWWIDTVVAIVGNDARSTIADMVFGNVPVSALPLAILFG